MRIPIRYLRDAASSEHLIEHEPDEPLLKPIPNRGRGSLARRVCDLRRKGHGEMSAKQGNSLFALFLESLVEADDAVKRELAACLHPYLAYAAGRLLAADEKARQLGLHPETLVKMAGAGRCRRHEGAGVAVPVRKPRDLAPSAWRRSCRFRFAGCAPPGAEDRPSVAAIRGRR